MLNQRDYDLAQVESEQRIKEAFDEWRTAFLKGRQMTAGAPMPPPDVVPPEGLPQEDMNANNRGLGQSIPAEEGSPFI